MAGAGYKLFNTGDVLTAAQVNTYLQEQAVMRFANATARTTALSGVLAEGMVSYLDDVNQVQVYNGSAWVNVGDGGDITAVTAGTGISGGGTSGAVTITNSMATEITAKGDLIVGTGNATFDNLAAGSNGESLVADSTTTTGLRWQADWNTGKNKIINGDFAINQRGFTSRTTIGYGFDRLDFLFSGGTVTYSAQTFTPGAAPVAGYEAINFARLVTASQTTNTNYALLQQKIEDVRTFANQTVTFSFWAKASTGTPNIGICLEQSFGSGGSSLVITGAQVTAITSSWARYSFTITVPSVSGKTIGSGSFLNVMFFTSAGTSVSASGYPAVGLQNVTIDTWGWQLEAGSVATPFTTATGTLAGELAACQRYYWRNVGGAAFSVLGSGISVSTTSVAGIIQCPVPMRVTPTSVDSSNLGITDFIALSQAASAVTLITSESSPLISRVAIDVASGLTANRAYAIRANNSTTAFIGLSAEL